MAKNYIQNRDGNVATMFALCITTVMICLGAAIDYSGVSSQQQDLQDMVDSATLAAAKANTKKQSELDEIVNKFMDSHNSESLNITLDVKVINDQVVVTGNTTYDTVLMGLVGKPNMDVEARAASPIASLTPIELALVLDTTGSMSGNRVTALKAAANLMIDEFIKDDAMIAVSVVPFGKYVNVGKSRKLETWLDVTKDGTSETNEVCWDERITTKAAECTYTGNTIYYDDIRDGVNFGRKSYEEQTCTPAEYSYTGNEICEDRTTTYTWEGCVGSRPSPYNEQAAFSSQRIPGIMNETCGTEIQTLTTNMTEAKSVISSLTTGGNTYIPAGVMWGWRTLQDEVPINTNVDFGDQSSNNVKPAKVMLIMTDGANTLSQGGGEPFEHGGSDQTDANNRTVALCTAAKADGIQVFTLGFKINASDTATLSMLEQCATTPSAFFQTGDGAALKKAFKDIAGKLDFTRLAM